MSGKKNQAVSERKDSAAAIRPLLEEALRYHDAGRMAEAEQLYRQVLTLDPRHVDGLHLLGVLAHQSGHHDFAADMIGQAISMRDDASVFHSNLGLIFSAQKKFDEAMASYRRALILQPDDADTLNNMGVTLKSLGKLNEAMACFKRARALKPDAAEIYSNLLLAMIYSDYVQPAELAATAREFGERIADPLRRKRPFVRDRDPVRKLRIGYASPDFYDHAVNYFFEPLLRSHDRGQFEIFAYSNTFKEDAVTARLKEEVDCWRDIKSLNYNEAADLIEADRIDILVDLAGHTSRNRLLVFACKPAPVQVTWLGYPATTGMKAMDYRITDCYAEPEGMTEDLNVETLWRLPEIFCCYQAHENSPEVIDHPPFEDNGYITFGCFNNFSKVTDSALGAWSQILAQVPESRLLLEISGIEGPQFRASVEERLRRLNMPLDRVILEPHKKSNQFVLYNKIDIALDPFPCAGGTTSMDTLWMGVPFITLTGGHFVSRLGVTILSNAGLRELIANDIDEYVNLAVGLALNEDRLRGTRHHLRDRVAASPLMYREKFARNMETAYREMWRKWCDER